MTTDPELLSELKKLNQNLTRQNSLLKHASRAFTSGIFSALGSLFGTAVIAAILIYLFSQLNITKSLSTTLEKFVQAPTTNAPLSAPSPGQP